MRRGDEFATDREQQAGLRMGRRILAEATGYVKAFGRLPADASPDLKARGQAQAIMQALQLAINEDADERMPSVIYGVGFAMGSLAGQLTPHNRTALVTALEEGFAAALADVDRLMRPVGSA